MIFILARFVHEVPVVSKHLIEEELVLPTAQIRYLYAPYMLNGFHKPKIFMTDKFREETDAQSMLGWVDAFTLKRARVSILNKDLEVISEQNF